MSKDGEPVIMHDYTLDRTTSLKGHVKETPWSAMKAAGVPHLADYTRTTKDRIISVIEIKGGDGVAKAVVDHVVRENMLDQTIVFSFNDKIVEEVKTLNPSVFAVWLIGAKQTPEAFPTTKATFERTKANALGVGYTNCTAEFVASVHALKAPLFVWTVPPGPQVDRLKRLKVNFIITDHPGDVRKQLAGN
jgi:glycerophosphoryl diester phosphodiesterase